MKPTQVLDWIANYKPTAIATTDLKRLLQTLERRVITDIVLQHELSNGLLNINYKGTKTFEEVVANLSHAEPGDYYANDGKYVFVLSPITTTADVVACKLTEYPNFLYAHGAITEEQPLIIPEPFAEVYRYWLEYQIDFAQSEYEKVQNSAATFNAAWDAFARWYIRNCKPISKGFLYI